MQVSDDPRVGTQLAGYRVETLLGRGGMSVVYLAEDVRLRRNVALKLLAAHLAEDESFRERFLRESQLAASIDHPNIIPIYEAGETERAALHRHALRRGSGPQGAAAARPARAAGGDRDPRPGGERARRGPRARPRPPRREALQRPARHRRRPRRLRPRLPGGLRPHEAGRRRDRDRRRRPPDGDDRLRRARADRRRATSTGAPTSTRSAACSTNASRASRRSGASRTSRSSSRTSRRSRRRSAPSGRSFRLRSTRSSPGRSPRIPSSATRPAASSPGRRSPSPSTRRAGCSPTSPRVRRRVGATWARSRPSWPAR